MDDQVTLAELKKWISDFIAERQWEPYHTPKNVAMSIGIEAGELMEIFQWLREDEADPSRLDPETLHHAGEELVDVVFYCLDLCDILGLDFSEQARMKLEKNRRKYPRELFLGRYERPKPESS